MTRLSLPAALTMACAASVITAAQALSVTPQAMSISGRVVSAATGRPIPGAQLSMNPGWDVVLSATADADGRFRFNDLFPARYYLRARAAGYGTRGFGEEHGLSETRIAVNASRPAVDLEFALHSGGTIAGVVTNDLKVPVVKAAVRAVYRNPFDDGFTFIAGGTTETDGRGAYRLTGLGEGEYLVAVADGLSRAFAPAEPTIATARRITIGADTEVTGVNIQTRPTPTGIIEGTFAGVAATASTTVNINLVREEDTVGLWPAATIRAPGGAPFMIANVPVGRYVLIAKPGVTDADSRAWARDAVVVTANSTTRATVTLRDGARISGVVTGKGYLRGYVRLSAIRNVSAQAADARAAVGANGAFTMSGIAPGRYRWVRDQQLTSSGRWLLSVFVSDEDITDAPLDMTTRASIENVRITLTEPAKINGTIQNAAGELTTAGAVIAFSVESRYWTSVSRRVQLVRADTDGYYQVDGLPPGRYKIAHLTRLAPGQQWDPAFLNTLAGAQEITLSEGQVSTVPLRLR